LATIRKLERSRNDAIRTLDFERASAITKQLDEASKQRICAQRHSLLAQPTHNTEFGRQTFDSERSAILARRDREIVVAKSQFRDAAATLANRHRHEAQLLTNKHRSLYLDVREAAESGIASAIESARILAKCAAFDAAIGVRDATSPPVDVGACCERYRRQFQLMIRRQETEFEELHARLKDRILALVQQAEEAVMDLEGRYASRRGAMAARLVSEMLLKMEDSQQRATAVELISPRKERRTDDNELVRNAKRSVDEVTANVVSTVNMP
jgi:hypothetical protein